MEQEMERRGRSNGAEGDDEKWVHDSSVDYKGRVPLRASTGVWKAAFFIITIEISERLSYFGLSTDLITYMSKVLHQDLKTAAKNVNYWTGVTTVMPLLGGFLADAYTGRFYTVLLSSIVYVMGLSLLTMSQFIPRLKACNNMKHCGGRPRRIHEVVFYLGMYFVSLGTGGHKPCLESFGADQFDDNHPGERKKKMSYFNWWNFALCCGLLAGVTIIVYVDQSLGWGVSYLILTLCMTLTILTFYAGKAFYRYRLPEGSPLTPMFQVLVAAVAKRNLPLPSNPDLLYEVPKSHKSKRRLLCHTNKLRFLDKAAIIEDMEGVGKKQISPWRLVTVTKVEEMKLVLNMVPIWLATLTFGLCVAQASTFFIKQGTTMNRKIIKGLISIPPGSIYSISAVGMIVSVSIYEKVLVPLLRRATGTERGIKILQRIGLGMIFSVVSMITAAMVERRRLRRSAGEEGERRMSVLWLAPQYLILGFGDGFTLVGLQEYFYDQVPDSMRSLGIAFYLSVIGVGNFYSSLLITAVDHATEMSCGRSWFREDMNESRLDNFYWLLAAMSALNLCVFVFLAKRYSYKTVQGRAVLSPSPDHDQEDIHPVIS